MCWTTKKLLLLCIIIVISTAAVAMLANHIPLHREVADVEASSRATPASVPVTGITLPWADPVTPSQGVTFFFSLEYNSVTLKSN